MYSCQYGKHLEVPAGCVSCSCSSVVHVRVGVECTSVNTIARCHFGDDELLATRVLSEVCAVQTQYGEGWVVGELRALEWAGAN